MNQEDESKIPLPVQPTYSKYDKYEAARQLTKAIDGSREVLVQATTIFPFTLFPDTVTIGRANLTITHRSFFGVAEVMSIRIQDVLSVTANMGPFFGSLQISTRFYDTQKPYEVHWLWRKDAIRLKRILQGYILAAQQEIDTSALSTEELAAMLDTLGQGPAAEE